MTEKAVEIIITVEIEKKVISQKIKAPGRKYSFFRI